MDDGGPRREFYLLLSKELFTQSGLFCGWPNNVVPIHDAEAVASNKFFMIGKMISTSLIHGAQPLLCFSHGVAEYLVYDEIKCPASLEDIPDYSVNQRLV